MDKRTMKTEEILNLKLNNSDFDKDLTIRGYFRNLLVTVWRDGEGFNGKRPFGNSGWEYDIYRPLLTAGVIEGSFDEDGDIENLNTNDADKFIINLIESALP